MGNTCVAGAVAVCSEESLPAAAAAASSLRGSMFGPSCELC